MGHSTVNAAARTVGWIWFVAPLAILAYHVRASVRSSFISFEYYIVVWGALLAVAACGAWYLTGMPGAKWALRFAGALVGLFVMLNGLVSASNAPYYGGHDYVLYFCLALVIAFCMFTIAVAGRNVA